jgi:hypothetical protein
MSALGTAGIVRESGHHVWELTSLGLRLCAGRDSLAPWAMAIGESAWAAWGELFHSVRTGESAFRKVHGVNRYDYLDEDEGAADRFDATMALFSRSVAPSLLSHYDFSWCEELVDVGGGTGELLVTILAEHPSLRGVVFEKRRLRARAERTIGLAGLNPRCRFVAGDFRVGIPEGASAYLLKDVLHNWPDNEAIGILQNCSRAMPSNGRLLVIEALRKEGDRASAFLDLHMLVMHGGRRRGESEFRQLFESSGLRVARVIPTGGPAIIEGVVAAA